MNTAHTRCQMCLKEKECVLIPELSEYICISCGKHIFMTFWNEILEKQFSA